jgi:hypothetical protein
MVMMPGSDPRLVEINGDNAEHRRDQERAQHSLETAARGNAASKPSLMERLRKLLRR